MTHLTPLFPVIGVVVGAVMTWAASALDERARWRRAHSTRWDERQLNAYVDYAAAVKDEVRICLRMASSRGLGTMTTAIATDDGVLRLVDAEDKRSTLFEAVLLLADAPTVQAARRWQGLVWDLHGMVDGTRDVEQEEFMTAFRAAGIARDDFYAAARAGLEVTSAFERSRDFRELPTVERRV